LDLAKTCDVFVTNLRPGKLASAGLSYRSLIEVRPDIVYCQAHGYSEASGRQDSPAYDDIIQAETGVVDAVSQLSGEPQLAPTIMADKVCALTIAYAVLAALYRRATTGRGDHIEVPMADTMKSWMLVEHGAAAIPQPALGAAGYPRVLNPHRRPWPTRDGWMVVLPYTKQHYDSAFAALGRNDLLGDPRYATGRDRIANASFLYEQIGSMLSTRTTAEWLELFSAQDVPAAAVSTLDDLVASLPDAEHPIAGAYKVIEPPVTFTHAPQSIRRPAARIGEHTKEVLLEVGYSNTEIARLARSGALG
jgi:crotonobetainyl-CoA:carnitine CoA-transferase CaiB-like acyl-CoA transferase